MTLAGAPDTTFSIGEEFDAWIERTSPIPTDGILLKWEATDPNTSGSSAPQILAISGGATGTFRITQLASAQYKTLSIGARFTDYIYQVVVGRNIVVGQRVADVQLSCIEGPCNAITPLAGAPLTLSALAQDARGNAIRAISFAMARADAVSRDPAVVRADSTTASLGRFHLTPVAPGTTWVVVTMDIAVDSVQLTVGTP